MFVDGQMEPREDFPSGVVRCVCGAASLTVAAVGGIAVDWNLDRQMEAKVEAGDVNGSSWAASRLSLVAHLVITHCWLKQIILTDWLLESLQALLVLYGHGNST